ncbi:hypothetical protein ASF49_12260 [Methylobacterium sp. Leaf104]|uniref:hypothetical protein n=1 Tax=Methylobacterium TaxID=407 RepID=UPI0006F6E408|nr:MULTISPECIES: hypothetical protein [Methylobacterium]KQP30753.1 hypothetical protein ASF49_12260 [Methylobacterium sp. Leaf104]MCI9882269.1 hypothetical protein [Methylobacterium goesingense]
MRHGPVFHRTGLVRLAQVRLGLASSVALLGTALSLGTAEAQSRPGWVDPPARQAETPGSGRIIGETPSGEKPVAEKPAAETPAPARIQAESQAPQDPTVSERTPMASHRRRIAGSSAEGRRSPMRSTAPERLHIRPRLADTPTPMAPPVAASEARFPEWAVAATRLTDRYLDSVSAPGDAMVAAAPRFYAERVRFHGRTLSLAALIAEKRRFVRRWPERRYEAQGGVTRTACNAASATCIVHTTFDFRADNPVRGVRSQGVSELTLTISFAGERPLIVAESSRVLRRYGAGPQSAIAGAQRGA